MNCATDASSVDEVPCHIRSSPPATPTRQTTSSWRSLFSFTCRSHLGVLMAAVLASMVIAAIRTVLSIILGKVFDIISEFGTGTRNGDSAMTAVSQWCLVLLGLGLSNWLAGTAFLGLWVAFGELQADSARREMFHRLLSRDLAWFAGLDQGISSLLVSVQSQTRDLQFASSQVFGFLVCDMATACASLAIAFYYSWKLTLVLLSTLPVSFIILALATRQLEPAIQAQRIYLATASKLATASINAIDIVKVFDGLGHDMRQYSIALQLAARRYLVQARCNSVQIGYVGFWVVFMFVVGFWYGIVLVNDGLPPGHVVTTFYSALAAFQGIEALVPNWLVLSKGKAAGASLSIMTSDSSQPSLEQYDSIWLENCVGHVKLMDVSFTYPSSETVQALSSSTFHFTPGQPTFVVGESGSGKSTVGCLVAGLYSTTAGQILIDGKRIDMLDNSWFRQNVTIIHQSSILFNDSLFNNIALGHPNPRNVTHQEVLGACQFALLQSTIADLPNGLSTNVGSDGHGLSGGQMQQVALARAYLRNPTILVLDEVTSGLDRINRELIMNAVRQWRTGKTTIVITHDLSEINDDEYIYVMANASIVEKGLKRHLSCTVEGRSSQDSSPRAALVDPPVDVGKTTHRNRALSFNDSSSFLPSSASNSFSWEPRGSFVCCNLSAPWRTTERRVDDANAPVPSACMSSCPHLASEERITKLWETQRCRFSTFVQSKFFTLSDLLFKDREVKPIHSPDSASSGLDELNLLKENFIFGASERRANISELRLAIGHHRSDDHNPSPDKTLGKTVHEGCNVLSTLRTVWPNLEGMNKLFFVLGLLACFGKAVTTPAFSYCLAQLLGVMWASGDRVIRGRNWAFSLLGVAIADGLFTGAGRYLLESSGQAWVDNIRLEAMKRILQQPRWWFNKRGHSAGRMVECLERNAEEMRNIVGRFLPIVIAVCGILSISVIWASIISWRLTLVALAPLPLVLGAVQGYATVSGRWEERCNDSAQNSSAVMLEAFVNIGVVRALTLEGHFSAKHSKSAKETLCVGMRRAAYTSWLFGLYQSMPYPLAALVFYYGMVLLAGDKQLGVAEMLQVVNLLLFGIGTAADICSAMPQLTMAQATAAQLLSYANLPLDRPAKGSWSRRLHCPLPVRLHDLDFSYYHRSNEGVLKGVSLDISPGECIAIVGRSGCGKSTIASILLGLYKPSSHSFSPEPRPPPLSFANASYADIDMQHLCSTTMAFVSQAPFLFPATIADNIVYGLAANSPYRQSQSIILAAKAVGLDEFITSLPEGYNTVVGDGGQTLSGGQAQRLTIARALIRRPLLLILDEPTSALDSENSALIGQVIRDLMHGPGKSNPKMAVVLITHSTEMMQVADRMVVLENGMNAEEGTFEDLLRARGLLYHILSGGEWFEGKRS
ncbi:hypothetical protein DCS_04671 [Drechmeria coniospora]|uniref:ABC a-pheromone efflux pump AtrD n=1 Tax=Drechmeria coniospora TaxID=98403 RepID=A0A151GKP4_DRECN|nr:hypothetical protein DCS_04671 [Drechmeria coniospora]KYK57659.1 hypothetical protein DCS_04671 [Drechmeria coniospora]